ncbi:MAG: agmatine deiminase family protein [Bdellovibrionota bacterium]
MVKFIFLATLATSSVQAQSLPISPTAQQAAQMAAYNQRATFNSNFGFTLNDELEDMVARPFADYERAGYLVISEQTSFGSEDIKEAFARNIPMGVTLVVTTNAMDNKSVRKKYEKYIDASRLKVVSVGMHDPFWARDGFPIPVIATNTGLILVDANYHRRLEPDAFIGAMFNAPILKNDIFFEGGNFMGNDQGLCFIVNNHMVQAIDDKVFKKKYGCKRLIRLPHLKGIGHVDERARFISADTVITDSPEFKKIFEDQGLKVHMLPTAEGTYETYVNSVTVNGTVFVPIFDQANDAAAIKVYSDLGLKVVPLNTKRLANEGMGSLHCITMTYPAVPFIEQ